MTARIDTTPPSRPQPTFRSLWRQRVVEAERGFTAGFRANSAFFFYFFTTSVLISFAVVLGLSVLEWAILILSVATAISSELFFFSIQRIGAALHNHLTEEVRQLLSMATAACMLLLMGAIITIVTILAGRAFELYG